MKKALIISLAVILAVGAVVSTGLLLAFNSPEETVPEKRTPGIPNYPGAVSTPEVTLEVAKEVQSQLAEAGSRATPSIEAFSTTDSCDQVIAWYEKQLSWQAGFVDKTNNTLADAGGRLFVLGNPVTADVLIVPDKTDPAKTTIIIMRL